MTVVYGHESLTRQNARYKVPTKYSIQNFRYPLFKADKAPLLAALTVPVSSTNTMAATASAMGVSATVRIESLRL